MADDPDAARRRFLKIATCGLGAGIGAAIAAPALGYLVYPAGRRIVTTPKDPIDIGPASAVPTDGSPIRLAVVAPTIRDGWTTATDVALGAAWLRRTGDTITAFSGTCPHLGCAIALRAGAAGKAPEFGCPCHDSAFKVDGSYVTGPARRGLDPLPVEVDAKGRLRLTWIQYKPDISGREPQS
jgi:menaquinol-cytochrome c reductase iron-sulfur subunit